MAEYSFESLFGTPVSVSPAVSQPREKAVSAPKKGAKARRPRGERVSRTAEEALASAVGNQSVSNFPRVIEEFAARGIAEDDIRPKENVFTYNAWVALGRRVRKGEHGVKICTYAPVTGKDEETGETKVVGRRPWTSTVFHISQTDPIENQA